MMFNLLIILSSSLFMGGLFLDGWAHNHLESSLETFFTPWHAALYGGFFACFLVLFGKTGLNFLKTKSLKNSIPPGYGLSLLGVILFGIGGVLDLIWHSIFGIEVSVEALLSPTHLLLAFAGALIFTGPLRQGLIQDPFNKFFSGLSFVLSATYLYSLLTFFTQFAHPFYIPYAATSALIRYRVSYNFLTQGFGITAILLQTIILVGLSLFLIRMRKPPFGTFSLILTLNAALIAVLHDYYSFIPAAFLAGLSADILITRFKLPECGIFYWRLFSFLLPVIFFSLYFLTIFLTDHISWTIHLWTGSIFLAGIVGLLMSYLVKPPIKKDY